MSWKLTLTLALCVVAATGQPDIHGMINNVINKVITELMDKKMDFLCPDLSDPDEKICESKAKKCMSALTPFMYGDGTKDPLEIYKTCKKEATQTDEESEFEGPSKLWAKFFRKKPNPEAMKCCIGKKMEILKKDNVTIDKNIPMQMFDEKIELLELLKMGVENCTSLINPCQLDEFCICTMQYCIANVSLE